MLGTIPWPIDDEENPRAVRRAVHPSGTYTGPQPDPSPIDDNDNYPRLLTRNTAFPLYTF